ncbi:Hypothetical protein RMHFA_03954 (plasmid) [Roseomonas mucosa]|nr:MULTISPECIES: hypothetical protein [Roseomonas]USQ74184.1 hypothetical protein NF552_22625 [Roseomonas mucosa]UZO99407.1 Hypothetical protein RMHFA_03954 [Roseomonas mucosa]
MSTLRGRKLKAFFTENAHANESPLFRWLWDHYEAVEEGLTQHKTGWDAWIARLKIDGVKGKRGAEPSASIVVRTWQRVCREKALLRDQARAPKLKVGKSAPNRSPKTNHPPPGVERPPNPPTPPKMHPPFASDGGTSSKPAPADADLPPEAQAEMDKLRARLRHADRALRIGRSQ